LICLTIGISFLVLYIFSIKKIEPTQVLIKTSKFNEEYKICKGSILIIPIIHNYKLVDLKIKIIEIERVEYESISCGDGIRIEIKVEFIIEISKINKDIQLVIERIDCSNTFNIDYLKKHFKDSFLDAIKSISLTMNYEEINGSYMNNNVSANDMEDCWSNFKQKILHKLGTSLNGRIEEEIIILDGYCIRGMRIIEIEMLHDLDAYNPDNINDAKGKRKILEITAELKKIQDEIDAEIVKFREEKERKIAEMKRIAEIFKLENQHEIEECKKDKNQISSINIEKRNKFLTSKKLENQHEIDELEKQQKQFSVINSEKRSHEIDELKKEKEQALLIEDEKRKVALISEELERENKEIENQHKIDELKKEVIAQSPLTTK